MMPLTLLSSVTSAGQPIPGLDLSPHVHFADGDVEPAPKAAYDFSCLSRDQKVMIESAFQQNAACHQTLNATAAKPPSATWQIVAMSLLAGMVAGIVMENQFRH